MHKLYTAGPITGLNLKTANEWPSYVKEQLKPFNIIAYRPLRGKGHLSNSKALPAVVKSKNPSSTSKGIFGRDKYDVMSADCILVNLLNAKIVSIGTMWEMAWANLLQKPIILVMEDEGNVHEHSFVLEGITYRVNNLDEGIELVKLTLLDN